MAHVWIHRRVSGLYTPAYRTSTTETYFKSYGTAIAKRISDDVIILDVSNYSNTTRKHQHSVWEASSHLTQLCTYLGVDDSVESNIEYYLRDMEAQITTLSRAISNSEAYRAFNRSKQQIERWCSVYGDVKLPKELPLLEEQMEVVYKGFVQRRAKADATKYQKESERKAFIEAMKPRVERMRGDEIPLWRQHKTIDVDNYFDHAEQTRAKYFGVSLTGGYYSYGFNAGHYNHIRLSKDGNYLETDGHATVPLREACVLCDRLEKGKDVIGLKLGHYTVLEKTDDYLKIGCHKFQWSELKHLRAICANAS